LSLYVRRTHAKEKRRDFYISGLKLSRGEVGGEERRICRSKQDNKTTNK
jgi:hypothetical protein